MAASEPRASGQVSNNCDLGNHRRCLGQVYVYPPVGDAERYIVECACPIANCGHGPEASKGSEGE